MNAPGPIPPTDNRIFVADGAHHLPGRLGYPIRLIVIHNTETDGTGNAPSGLWLSTQSPGGESAHHLYGRDGTRYDLVRRVDTAYHAGNSIWGSYHGSVQGVAVCNLISIGHELESTARLGTPGDGYTTAQYATLAYTLAGELFSYGLPWSAVVSHASIAQPPGRRHDPSAFDWPRLRRLTLTWWAFFRSLPPGDVARWIV